ncbi:MAG: DUF2834 domain-containing protein [Deltaproteobacteria bacterium]|jgi:hypothetical protein|nr:DUF2834 domain-containing protein [Deltaproteobacteria bacterium]
MAIFYLCLAFIGAVGPYSFLGQFLMTHGLNFTELKTQLWASPVSSFFGVNMIVASLVTLLFIFSEGRRLKLKGLWLPLVATVAVGVSCGLPFFLYLRRLTLDRVITADNPQAVHEKTVK